MPVKHVLLILAALAAAAPALVLRLAGIHLDPVVSVVVFGGAILASAFILAWAAEAVQVDISGNMAFAILAFIAILPEYAVDLLFAWKSGAEPIYTSYAAANMTGANRLLLGVGWSLVVLLYVLFARRRKENVKALVLHEDRRIEMLFLGVAGIYAFLIPMTHRISLLDSVVLLAIFAVYMWRVAREGREEPDLDGIAESVAHLSKVGRRLTVTFLFLSAAAFILASAEPFAEGLVDAGRVLGVDEFLLVQWIAPFASESPEFIVAIMLAVKGKGDDGLNTLLSSKVNQWTLLIGCLPIAHALNGGGYGLEMDARQVEEFVLTSAQTVLGLAFLIELRFRTWEALVLMGLFFLQFIFPQTEVRLAFSGVYLLLAIPIFIHRRRHILPTLRAIIPPPRARADASQTP